MFPKSDDSAIPHIVLRTSKHLEEEDILAEVVARLLKPEINVLYYQRHYRKLSKVYLIPVFTRFMITRITAVDLEQDFGVIAGRLFITIRYKGVQKKYINSILDNLLVTINDSESLKFCMKDEIGQSYINEEEETATYVRTMKLQALLSPEVFLAPFQRLYLQTNITFLPYFHEERNPENNNLIEIIAFKFNNMINRDVNTMFTVRSRKKALKYGEYSLAKSSDFLKVEISNSDGRQITTSKAYQEDLMENQQKSKEVSMTFKEASTISFSCMLYRNPSVSIISIFVPMWILGFITLMVFFQSPDFDNKVINTATIYISFATYFQVIRSVLPKSTHISLMQIFVYSILSICILVLIESLLINSSTINPQAFQFERPLFLISFCIQLCTFLLVLGGLLLHQYSLKPLYNKIGPEETPHIPLKIFYSDWQNESLRQSIKVFKYDICYADNKKKIMFQEGNPEDDMHID